jgi:hypothetical protein
MLVRFVCLLAWCVLALCATTAKADPIERAVTFAPLRDVMRVEPGATCLDPERIAGHVKMWLGSAQVDAALRVRVFGDPSDAHSAYFEIERGVDKHRRELRPLPHSCDDAHAVIGLALAIALDAARMQRDWLISHPEFLQTWTLGTELTGAYSVLPESALGLQANLERGWTPWFSTRADVFGLFAWDQRIAGSAGRFDALLVASSIEVCAGGWPDTRLRLSLCAGAALGLVHAWGHDYAPNRAATALWFAARSGLRFELHAWQTWLLDIEMLSSIRAPAYESRGGEGGGFTRHADATGFMLSLGPAFAF